ncbi:MAG: hypothetical protein HY421_01400 [Candidatus Kerfeldbacteria bacterium]|nr:hypothetical protein [Candidatus Kerfeldbacteria bacterium]
MTAKTPNPKQAVRELERRFREETKRLRQEPSAGSEGYTNVYSEEQPEQGGDEGLPAEEPTDDQSSTSQVSGPPRVRPRLSKRPAQTEAAAPSPETGGQAPASGTAPPASGAGEPTGQAPGEQLSRAAQFAERTRTLQKAAGAVKQAAQIGRAVAATGRAVAALAQAAAFLVSPAMWPVWIGVAIAAGIFLLVILVVAAACSVDTTNPVVVTPVVIPTPGGPVVITPADVVGGVKSVGTKLLLGIDCPQ